MKCYSHLELQMEQQAQVSIGIIRETPFQSCQFASSFNKYTGRNAPQMRQGTDFYYKGNADKRQAGGWRLNKICHRCFSQPENQSLDSTDALCTSTQNWMMVLLWGLSKGLLGNSYTIKMTTEKNFPNTLCEGRLIMSEKDKCNMWHITGYRTHTTVEWSDIKVQSNNNLNRITPRFVNVAQFIVNICSFYLHISRTTEARQVREESSQPSFH